MRLTISGGGSALLALPAAVGDAAAWPAITRALLHSGAPIDQINCVRKHLSRVKGGRMVENFRGKTWLTLIISVVVGDPLDVIASGPTVPDPTSFADAYAILERYGVVGQIPGPTTP